MTKSATGPAQQPVPEQDVGIGPEDIGRIMERLGEGALLVDLSTQSILKANEHFTRLSGFGSDEIRTVALVGLHDLGDMERILRSAQRPEASGEVLAGMSCLGKDGIEFKADLRVTTFSQREGALVLLTYHPPSGGERPEPEEDRPSAPPSLPIFTQRLAAARERDDLGRVLVEASASLMGTDQVLLVGHRSAATGMEILASAGIPAGALEATGAWLGDLVASGILSGTRPRVVEDLSAEGGLAEVKAELATAGARAFVIFPLESEGRILGAWGIAYPDGRLARSCDLDLGHSFAAHLAGTLAGVVLLERTRREKSHHEVLNRIISWLRGPLELEGILQSLTVELCKTLEADRCVLLVADEGEGEPGATLRVEYEHCTEGLEPLKQYGPIRFASTALGAAVLYSKEPLAAEDLRMRPDLTEDHEDLVKRFDLRGFIVAKIVSRQEVIGLVAVGMSGRPSMWTAEEIELVGAVADHAAVTMATGRLARASQERAAQVERERREWERTFDAIPDMLSIHDGYGRMLRTNLAMQVRLGGDPRRFAGKECGEILETVMGRSGGCPHEEAQRTRRAITCEVEGERGVFALTVIPCFDAAGTCLYIIHVCKEITEEKQIREQLLQTEKMAAVGNLVSGVAHELNNPLSGVIGFSEILLERATDAKLKKSVERIRDEGERAARIVRNLLTFARKHKPESTMVDVNAVLEKTIELRAYDLRVNKIQVTTEMSKALPNTLADPNQLLQVFMNVVTNAEQAMREAHGKGSLKLSTELAGKIIRITFKDDGPGISPEHLKKIFDPFFTTKAVGKGTGLGLSICHGIIKEHGGTITANSAVGQGTAFTIELPVAAGPVARAEVKKPAARKAKPSTILVVDDELSIRDMIQAAFEERGHSVDAVEGGLSALEAIKGKTYDAIISDLKMPEMDGQELYARISSDHPQLASRVVFISGDTVSAETRTFFEKAGRPYLLKPFKVADLIETVEKVLPPDDAQPAAQKA